MRSRVCRASKGNEINEAKKVLATEATALVHGRNAADQAAETARKTFEEGAPAETLPTVSRRAPDRCSHCRCPDWCRLFNQRSAPSNQEWRN